MCRGGGCINKWWKTHLTTYLHLHVNVNVNKWSGVYFNQICQLSIIHSETQAIAPSKIRLQLRKSERIAPISQGLMLSFIIMIIIIMNWTELPHSQISLNCPTEVRLVLIQLQSPTEQKAWDRLYHISNHACIPQQQPMVWQPRHVCTNVGLCR